MPERWRGGCRQIRDKMIDLPVKPDEARWASLSLTEQMANIGSEVGRTYKWTVKSKPNMAIGAYVRALDLIDLTIKYGRRGMIERGALLKELCRSRDLFTDAFEKKDIETLGWLDLYFGQFAKAYSRL